MNMIQVGIIGALGTLFAIQFQNDKKEYGIYIGVGISIFIFFNVVGKMESIVSIAKEVGSYIRIEGTYMNTLVKILGVTYVAEFAAVICKDTGHNTLATQIEMFGKLTILTMSLPVLLALLKTIENFFS